MHVKIALFQDKSLKCILIPHLSTAKSTCNWSITDQSLIYKWVQLCSGVGSAWFIDFCDLDAWPKSHDHAPPLITDFSRKSVCWPSQHGLCCKMSPNLEIKDIQHYKCLNCSKRTKKGSKRIFLSTVKSEISKKIREIVLKGRSAKEDDLICNKCRQSLTKRIRKGGYIIWKKKIMRLHKIT